MKTCLMTGAALLLLASSPALAGQSSAAEQQATRALNMMAAQKAAPTMPIQTASTDSAGAATLSTMTNPPSKIANASVLDSSGKVIGAVQRVEVTPQGQPTEVAVALIGQDDRLVVLDAKSVSYDPSRNQIMARASGKQIAAL